MVLPVRTSLPKIVPLRHGERILAAILPVLFLMAHAAVITSLGLALATWLKRTGLAIAASVGCFVLFSIGWVLLIELVVRRILHRWYGSGGNVMYDMYDLRHSLEQALAALSPLAGQTVPLNTLIHRVDHASLADPGVSARVGRHPPGRGRGAAGADAADVQSVHGADE